MPAHNEAAGIGATLDNVRRQLGPADRLLVVADNCDDQTAAIAQRHGGSGGGGVEVLERHDELRRGKGYALAHGVAHLRDTVPPEQRSAMVIVVLDADCLLAPGAIDALANAVSAGQRPAQAVYLMEPPPQASPRDLLSALAFQFKNQVRPLGLHGLGMGGGPCLLTGTGMAFPWATLAGDGDTGAELATGNIVEDMKLGLDLARAGHAPMLCPEALVSGILPGGDAAARTQRQRWEHGHLHTLLVEAPRLLTRGLLTFRWSLLLLGLELLVPPLSLLVAAWGVGMVLAAGAGWWGLGWVPVLILAAAGGLMGLGLLAGWARFARKRIPGRVILLTPFYILWKIPMYAAFLVRRQRTWVRTARN
jgi:cellulose synthase/poly-beta-1,6-N-acetylglucosamine synthase-like glycosyltransferase